MFLEIRDLHLQVNDKKLIKNLSFDLERGKTLGIVGESGSGKSLTALSLMELLPPNIKKSGSFFLEGVDLFKTDPKDWHKIRGKEISMIFQDSLTSLNPTMKIGAQISEAAKLFDKATAKKRVKELINIVQLPLSIVDRYPHELSGGMRQRIAISIALARNPKLLIADEPTTALDVTVQAQIIALFQHLQTLFNLTIIIISHDLGVISALADEVLVFLDGEIVERGSVFTVLKQPKHPYTQSLISSTFF